MDKLIVVIIFNLIFFLVASGYLIFFGNEFYKNFKVYKKNKNNNFYFFVNWIIILMYLIVFFGIITPLLLLVITLFGLFQAKSSISLDATKTWGYVFYISAIVNDSIIIFYLFFGNLFCGNMFILITDNNVIFFQEKINLEFIHKLKLHSRFKTIAALYFYTNHNNEKISLVRKNIYGKKAIAFCQQHLNFH